MLTGRSPHRLGIYDWISDAPGSNFMYLKKEETTIAELLKQAGYATFVAGKWHCSGKFNSPDHPQPDEHGFDHWFVTGQNLKRQLNPYEFVRNGVKVEKTQGHACEVVADEAIQWTNELRDKDKPFFQCVWFHEPHEPIASPPEIVAQYAEYDGTKPLYYANVTNLDKQIGRILENLDKQGLAENTLVFFTSDNGPAKLAQKGYRSRSHGSAGPFREYKWTLFEGGIRVPGIARWPGKIESGMICEEPISGVDVLPTLCAISGIPLPQGRTLDGVDITPVFEWQILRREIPLHWHYQSPYTGPLAVMRKSDWVVTAQWDIEHPVMGRMKKEYNQLLKKANLKDFKLYNIKMDEGQQEDLGQKYPEKLAVFSKELLRLHKEVQAEAPVW
jgi:arylsulfatase A